MSATCDECIVTGRNPDSPVHLCPLHAEAEAMKDVLRVLVAGGRVNPVGYGPAFNDARAILSRIEGNTSDA